MGGFEPQYGWRDEIAEWKYPPSAWRPPGFDPERAWVDKAAWSEILTEREMRGFRRLDEPGWRGRAWRAWHWCCHPAGLAGDWIRWLRRHAR